MTMERLAIRIEQAQQLWEMGKQAEDLQNYGRAHELYTEAHDLVVDCARLHQKAHERLRVVNLKLGNYGDLITDWSLHYVAPLKVFEIVAYFARSEGHIAAFCRRAF